MANYGIVNFEAFSNQYWVIVDLDIGKFFLGYDFMGSVDMVDDIHDAKWFEDEDSAYDTRNDLNDAESETDIDHDPHIGGPYLEFEISESKRPLANIIEMVQKNYPGFRFDRTEARYETCCMAIFVKY